MSNCVLIVAGGKGLRMNSEVPKQFLPVGGKPVLMRTIENFYRYDTKLHIVLVLPKEQQDYWAQLCAQYQFTIPHVIADGGETRFHSVKQGLDLAGDASVIAIHDGVRPFVAQEVIMRCYELATVHQAVIPVIDVVETIRQVDNDTSHTVDRDAYKLVQTPQVFTAEVIKKAYSQPYSPAFTDDASVVEAMGTPIFLTEGNRENIKITTPFDLRVASVLV
ncbi:2-C-methyl-D-erythritol 4-phosphate cytidylyltransferase [Bacteroides sp. 214]|uniref:2-C-methyl-D-erythritol 4-phosphate cytidylyltransferase n=1 Tax=Bacteroides sp. 214 TaxID=2302935 RepID=UPI0013D5F8BC|nr:2-C-methyl-D-erythritol 4-phosphate cytidylyltransferase [Bacteroides sp. 214]NDW13793.1 2-C-methyl-D-erythritol 4-phosphate cytidylyltransferase [Bacteroides sp. 214]